MPGSPNDDDDTAAHHGGGPLSAVFKWLWNYDLMIGKYSFRSLWLFVALTLAAFVTGAAVF